MPAAFRTDHFRPVHTMTIVLTYLFVFCLVEARPAGARAEFSLATEQFISATCAYVGALLLVVQKLSCERPLRLLLPKHPVLLGSQLLFPIYIFQLHHLSFWTDRTLLHFGQRKKVFVPRTTSFALRISAEQNGHIGTLFGGSMNELQQSTFNSFPLYSFDGTRACEV